MSLNVPGLIAESVLFCKYLKSLIITPLVKKFSNEIKITILKLFSKKFLDLFSFHPRMQK